MVRRSSLSYGEACESLPDSTDKAMRAALEGPKGFMYLVAILDWFSRYGASGALSVHHIDASGAQVLLDFTRRGGKVTTNEKLIN